MKNTKYFDDYQSAYNYYGGNIVPSNEIALIGNGSYIFVSSDNAVSGNTQYYDANLTNDEIVDTMTYTAYNNGVTYGEAIGYAQGYEGGYSYGYSYGYAEGEAQGGGSGTLTPEELDQQAFLFFTQGPGFENTNEVMNYVSNCGTQSCDIDALDAEQYKDYLANTSSFSNMDAPYNIYITLYDPTQTPEFQWGTWNGNLSPNYNVSGDDDVTVTITPSNDCKIGFGLLPIYMDPETGDIVPSPDSIPQSTFLKCFDNGETDEWDNAIYRHLIDVESGKTYEAIFTTSTDPESGDDVVEFTFEEVVQP